MTNPFTTVDRTTGEVLSAGLADDPSALSSDDVQVLMEQAPPNAYWYGGAWVARPPRPSASHVWNWGAHEWRDPRTLEDIKAVKRQQINAARLFANRSQFSHQGKAIACDQLSRSDIDGVNGFVATNGALPPSFPGAWKCIDNTFLMVPDVAAWNALYASMVNQGAQNFLRSEALKAQIDAAASPGDLASIRWPD
jgi:hypothetical protein